MLVGRQNYLSWHTLNIRGHIGMGIPKGTLNLKPRAARVNPDSAFEPEPEHPVGNNHVPQGPYNNK